MLRMVDSVAKDLPGFRPKKQGALPKVTWQPETPCLWTSPENTGIIMARAREAACRVPAVDPSAVHALSHSLL